MNKAQIKILSDISTASMTSLQQLYDKQMTLICDDLHEAILRGDKRVSTDIGIGSVVFTIEDISSGKVSIKFVPSYSLSQRIKTTVETNSSPLVEQLENSLGEQLVTIYKQLF